MENLSKNFKFALIWSVLGQFGYIGIAFITNVILARILGPNEFAVIAICSFFIMISNVLLESGLSGALIRKNDTSEDDYSTIFVFNLLIGIFLYSLIFIFSSYIENYYKVNQLGIYLRVLSLILIINSFQIVQNARLVKQLNYKTISLFRFISVFFASLIAIAMAYIGFGVWSLIVLQVLNSTLLTIIYSIKLGIPKFVFSKKSFNELYSFGMYTTLSSILESAFDNIYQLVLGKYFSLSQTGFYFQAKKFSEIPVGIIKSTTLGVVFSALSKIHNDKEKFNSLYSNIVRVFTVIVGLICCSIFLFSKDIILIIYGEKWLGANFYLKILSLASFFYMQEMFNRVLFKVFDRTDKIFYLEIIKNIIKLITLILGVYTQDVKLLMIGFLVTSILSYFINYYVSRTIYLFSKAYDEIIYMFKVSLVVLIVSLIHYIINYYFKINLKQIPTLLIIYFVLLKLLKVFDLKKDLKIIKQFNK